MASETPQFFHSLAPLCSFGLNKNGESLIALEAREIFFELMGASLKLVNLICEPIAAILVELNELCAVVVANEVVGSFGDIYYCVGRFDFVVGEALLDDVSCLVNALVDRLLIIACRFEELGYEGDNDCG